MSEKQTPSVSPDQTTKTVPSSPQPVHRTHWGIILLSLLALLLAAASAGGIAWLYYKNKIAILQIRQNQSEQEQWIQNRSRQLDTQLTSLQQTLNQEIQKRSEVEQIIQQSAAQQSAMNHLYTELTKNRADWLLSETETVLAIANQQLQLTKDPSAAIIALENVSQRLNTVNRPQFQPLKLAVAQDLQTLKTYPRPDIAGLTVKLNALQDAMTTLPLSAEATIPSNNTAANSSVPAAEDNRPFWRRALSNLKQEFNSLVSIRRIDQPEPLLTAEQTFYLRENLKLRLLDMKLALLNQDAQNYTNNIQTLETYIKRYFDTQNTATQNCLHTLDELKHIQIAPQPPSLSASLNALQALIDAQEPRQMVLPPSEASAPALSPIQNTEAAL